MLSYSSVHDVITVLDGTVSSSRCMEEPEMITMSGRAEVEQTEKEGWLMVGCRGLDVQVDQHK